jgi:hypothetical protein
MEDSNDADTSLYLHVEDDVAAVREATIAGANMVDAASDCGPFRELCEAALEAREVFVSLTFAKLLLRIDVNFG